MKYVIHREGESGQLGRVTLFAHESIRKRMHKRPIAPDRSLKVNNHSPDGFEFGYGGSGPAQLALAILLDFTNDPELSNAFHQDFKWDFICHMKHPGSEIEDTSILDWLDKKVKEE